VLSTRVFGGEQSGAGSAVLAYTGPGNVVSGATAWWGLRGYNAAVSNGVTKSVNIRRASDNSTQDFVILSNGNLDTASIATFISGTTGFVTKLYDQTGNGNDASQATAANQPQIFLNAIGALPDMLYDGGKPLYLTTGNTYTNALPVTFTWLGFCFLTGRQQNVMQVGGANTPALFLSNANPPTLDMYNGSLFIGPSFSANAWHTAIGVFTGAANVDQVALDGTETAVGGNVGTSGLGGSAFLGISYVLSLPAYIHGLEFGFWPSALTATQVTNLSNNESNYWNWAQYDVATQVWTQTVLRNGGSVSPTRQGAVDTLIKGLKADGVWSKLDRLWLLAAENSQAALTDLVGLTLATAVGSPTFTTDRGYTGTDATLATNYIDSGFNPTAGVTFTQNSAHISAWCVGNVASVNGGMLLGNDADAAGANANNILDTFTDGNVYARINDNASSGSQGAPASRQGHWIANRSGASASQLYNNGANFSSPNATSGAPTNSNMYILSENDFTTSRYGTPNQVAMASMGGSLSSTDASNFYSRLRTYMTAVGVP
jgi:hypothetical protein